MPVKRWYVYRNLNTGTFSVKYGGKVIAHPNSFVITDVQLKVSEKGRRRVLKNQVKNVHAMVSGTSIDYLALSDVDESKMIEVYYDPYRFSTFIVKETQTPVFELPVIYGKNNRIFTLPECLSA